MHLINRFVAAILRRIRTLEKRIKVILHTDHLHGPRRVRMQDDECALVTMVKDAEYFIDDLLKYHTALGVRHILVVDNGSIDDTVKIASKYDHVTVLRNTLPARQFECRLRADLARKTFYGGWLLFVDSDELFTPPGSHPDALRSLCAYCNENGYTAVICQVLDMFSDKPLSETLDISYAQSLEIFDRYSLKSIKAYEYYDDSIPFSWYIQQGNCNHPDIKILFGGIRWDHFSEFCCLTAQRLVRNARGIGIYEHPHFSTNVDCADVTALIRHYKFAGNIVSRETAQLAKSTWGHGQDACRMNKLANDPNYVIYCEDQLVFHRIEDLFEKNFLVSSQRFTEWF